MTSKDELTNEEVVEMVEEVIEKKEELPKIHKAEEVIGEDSAIKQKKAEKMIKNAMSDEVSMYLQKFEKEFKTFMLKIGSLSKKQMLRVIIKFAAHPVIDNNFNLSDDMTEKDVYNSLVNIHAAKSNAMLGTIMNGNKPKE